MEVKILKFELKDTKSIQFWQTRAKLDLIKAKFKFNR